MSRASNGSCQFWEDRIIIDAFPSELPAFGSESLALPGRIVLLKIFKLRRLPGDVSSDGYTDTFFRLGDQASSSSIFRRAIATIAAKVVPACQATDGHPLSLPEPSDALFVERNQLRNRDASMFQSRWFLHPVLGILLRILSTELLRSCLLRSRVLPCFQSAEVSEVVQGSMTSCHMDTGFDHVFFDRPADHEGNCAADNDLKMAKESCQFLGKPNILRSPFRRDIRTRRKYGLPCQVQAVLGSVLRSKNELRDVQKVLWAFQGLDGSALVSWCLC